MINTRNCDCNLEHINVWYFFEKIKNMLYFVHKSCVVKRLHYVIIFPTLDIIVTYQCHFGDPNHHCLLPEPTGIKQTGSSGMMILYMEGQS